MSHILFETPDGMKRLPFGRFQISGAEAAHARNLTYDLVPEQLASNRPFEEVVAAALVNEPKARFAIRLCAQVEPGFWVRAENYQWFRGQLRLACENTVRVRSDLGTMSEQILRVGASNYGRSDLNTIGDGRGVVQTWWSLWEWLGRGPLVAVSYSTTGRPWEDIVAGATEREIVRWFETRYAHMEWRPDTWETWSPVVTG